MRLQRALHEALHLTVYIWGAGQGNYMYDVIDNRDNNELLDSGSKASISKLGAEISFERLKRDYRQPTAVLLSDYILGRQSDVIIEYRAEISPISAEDGDRILNSRVKADLELLIGAPIFYSN